MDLKQTLPGSLDAYAVSMNGHLLIFQQDYNLCLKRKDRQSLTHRWCVSDEARSTYMSTRRGHYRPWMVRAK